MSARKQITVTRNYRHEPSHCVHALELILTKPVNKAARPAPEPDGCNDAAIVTNTEGVGHVKQRHDRSSQIT